MIDVRVLEVAVIELPRELVDLFSIWSFPPALPTGDYRNCHISFRLGRRQHRQLLGDNYA